MSSKMPEAAREIPPPETEMVTTLRVACDGSGPALGHPRVWLAIDPAVGWVECGYCDKRYILAEKS